MDLHEIFTIFTAPVKIYLAGVMEIDSYPSLFIGGYEYLSPGDVNEIFTGRREDLKRWRAPLCRCRGHAASRKRRSASLQFRFGNSFRETLTQAMLP